MDIQAYNIVNNKIWTWNNEWVKYHESIWGIIQKFRYANQISGTTFIDLIDLHRKGNRSIYSIQTIESTRMLLDKLDIFFNFSISQYYEQNIRNTLGPLYNANVVSRYFAYYLRYCPRCIEEGHHSIWHQLLFIKYCPLHNIELISYNQRNHQPIRLNNAIYSNSLNDIFTICKDEAYKFSVNHNNCLIILWYQNNLKKKIYGNLTAKYNNLSCHLFYFPFSCSYTTPKSLKSFVCKQDDLLRAIHLSEQDFILKGIEIRGNHYLNNVTDVNNIESQIQQLIEIYINAYKSISRYIRKRSSVVNNNIPFLTNEKGVAYFSKNKDYRGRNRVIHAERYAYIMWRRDVEGYDNYLDIDTSSPPKWPLRKNICRSPFFNYMLYELDIYKDNYNTLAFNMFFKVLEYMLPQMLLQHHENWLKYTQNLISTQPHGRITFRKRIDYVMPMYIVWFQKSQTWYLYKL